MRSIAIVGFSPKSADLMIHSTADEIWTMNHAYLCDVVPRIDRLYEIHTEEWFRRTELPNNEKYWQWLQEDHPFPIYMQDVHPKIPASKKYPFDEIINSLFPNFRHLPPEGQASIILYFTSTFSFMLAHAIYENVDRVEIYGVEMATATEYEYQKPGGEFMIGVAVGYGITVVIPEVSSLCKARLYAYDAIPLITARDIERYIRYYKSILPGMEAEAQKLAKVYNRVASNGSSQEDIEAAFKNSHTAQAFYNAHMGALTMAEYFGRLDERFISRQNLEAHLYRYRSELEKAKAKANFDRATSASYPGGDPDIQMDLFRKSMQSSADMFAMAGALQLIQKFIMETKMIEQSPEIILNITESKD